MKNSQEIELKWSLIQVNQFTWIFFFEKYAVQ